MATAGRVKKEATEAKQSRIEERRKKKTKSISMRRKKRRRRNNYLKSVPKAYLP